MTWLNRTVLGIGLASLFSDLSHETVTAILPSFLASMGVAAVALGTIEGVADGFSSAAKLYGGWLTDRLSRRKPLCAFGYGFMALATAVIAAAATWPIVLLGRCLAWLARGIRTPARKTLLADAVTPETYGRAFGFERTMDTLGAVIAPIMALAFLAWGLNQQQVIWISLLPAVLAMFAITFLVQEKTNHTPSYRPFMASMKNLPLNFKKLMIGVGIFGAGDFAHSLMTLYAVAVLTPEYGFALATTLSVGLYALHNIIYAGVSYPAGMWADRANKKELLVLAYLLGIATSIILMTGSGSLVVLAVAFSLGGACNGMQETLEDSLSAEMLPKESRGSGFGAIATVNGVGDFVSSIAVGWLWAAFGTMIGFGFSALLMLVGAWVVFVSRAD